MEWGERERRKERVIVKRDRGGEDRARREKAGVEKGRRERQGAERVRRVRESGSGER